VIGTLFAIEMPYKKFPNHPKFPLQSIIYCCSEWWDYLHHIGQIKIWV